MTVKIQVKGIPQARKALRMKRNAAERGVEKGMEQVSLFMEGEVKDSISGRKAEPPSVDTGRFRNSVKGTHQKDSAVIASNVSYAPFLEYGTSRGISPRRHFTNSLARNKIKIKEFLNENVKSAVE